MIDQNVQAEAKKMEGLAVKSLAGDKDAANALARESTELLHASPEYRNKVQAQLEKDRKESQGLLPEVSIQGPMQVVVEKTDYEAVKDSNGKVLTDPDGKPFLQVKDKDTQTFHDDGVVSVSPNDKFATQDKLQRVNDAGMPLREVAAPEVGDKDFLDVKKDAAGRVTSIERPGSLTTIEYDKAGNPIKIDGIDGQKWTKDADNSWRVVDEKGNFVETRTDVLVKPNGDIESKGIAGVGAGPADQEFAHSGLPESQVVRANGTREITYTDDSGNQTVVVQGEKISHYKGLDKFGAPLRDSQGNPALESDCPVKYVMEKDANGHVTSIERDGKVAKIKYDKSGSPTEISGLESGQTMQKQADGNWSVLDKDGKVVETRTDVVVQPNGDIESKKAERLPGQSGDEAFYRVSSETNVWHADGSASVRQEAAPAKKPQGHLPQRKVDDPLFSPTLKSGKCAPGDPLCSDLN